MRRALADEQATVAFGTEIYEAMPSSFGGLTLLLTGELGAGKSTFARAFIRAAGHEGAVPSPTYTLIEPYEVAGGKLYHVDLYRVSSEDELEYLGWSELSDGLRIIEWPERVPRLTNESDLRVHFEYAGDGRAVTVSALSEPGQELIQKIK